MGQFGLPALVISILTATIVLFCLIHIMYEYIKGTKTKHGFRNKILCYACIMVYIIYILYAFTWFFGSIKRINNNVHLCLIPWSTDIIFVIGKVSLYLFILIRLHSVFGSSSYGYNRSFLIKIGAIVVVFYMCVTIGFFTEVHRAYIFAINPDNKEMLPELNDFNDCIEILPQTITVVFFIMVGVSVIAEAILSVFLMVLFARKLILILVISSNQSSIDKITSKHSIKQFNHTRPDGSVNTISDTNTKSTVDSVHDKLMELVIKNTNLVAVTLLTTQLGLIIFGLNLTYLLMMDTIVNTVCIYLSFAFNDSIYKRLFICHNCCYNSCAKLCFCCCKPNERDFKRYNLNSKYINDKISIAKLRIELSTKKGLKKYNDIIRIHNETAINDPTNDDQ